MINFINHINNHIYKTSYIKLNENTLIKTFTMEFFPVSKT